TYVESRLGRPTRRRKGRVGDLVRRGDYRLATTRQVTHTRGSATSTTSAGSTQSGRLPSPGNSTSTISRTPEPLQRVKVRPETVSLPCSTKPSGSSRFDSSARIDTVSVTLANGIRSDLAPGATWYWRKNWRSPGGIGANNISVSPWTSKASTEKSASPTCTFAISGGNRIHHEPSCAESATARVRLPELRSTTRSTTSRLPSAAGPPMMTWRAATFTGAMDEVSATITRTGEPLITGSAKYSTPCQRALASSTSPLSIRALKLKRPSGPAVVESIAPCTVEPTRCSVARAPAAGIESPSTTRRT